MTRGGAGGVVPGAGGGSLRGAAATGRGAMTATGAAGAWRTRGAGGGGAGRGCDGRTGRGAGRGTAGGAGGGALSQPMTSVAEAAPSPAVRARQPGLFTITAAAVSSPGPPGSPPATRSRPGPYSTRAEPGR